MKHLITIFAIIILLSSCIDFYNSNDTLFDNTIIIDTTTLNENIKEYKIFVTNTKYELDYYNNKWILWDSNYGMVYAMGFNSPANINDSLNGNIETYLYIKNDIYNYIDTLCHLSTTISSYPIYINNHIDIKNSPYYYLEYTVKSNNDCRKAISNYFGIIVLPEIYGEIITQPKDVNINDTLEFSFFDYLSTELDIYQRLYLLYGNDSTLIYNDMGSYYDNDNLNNIFEYKKQIIDYKYQNKQCQIKVYTRVNNKDTCFIKSNYFYIN